MSPGLSHSGLPSLKLNADAFYRTTAVVTLKCAARSINLVSQYAPTLIKRKVFVFMSTALSADLSAVSCVDVPKLLSC